MPKKNYNKNNMKGGDKPYQYNSSKEWVTGANKLGNIDFLNKFEKGGRPLNNRSSSSLNTLLDLNNNNNKNDDSINKNMYKLNANKKEIDNAIKSLKNSEPLIEKLGSLKTKLNAEIRAIKSRDITSINPSEVTDDIKRGIPLTDRIITNNKITSKKGDLSNPVEIANRIIKYIRQDEKGESGRPIEREDEAEMNWGVLRVDQDNKSLKKDEIKTILNKDGNEDVVKFNIESMFGWKHIDLSKWPIGSLNDYIDFVFILLDQSEIEFKDDNDNGKCILNWFVKIAGQFYTGGGGKEGLTEYIKSKLTIKTLLNSEELKKHFFKIDENDAVSKFDKNNREEFMQDIHKLIETKSNSKLKNRKEYLVILLHWLFSYSISVLKQFKDLIKGNGFSDKNIKSFEASINAVDLLWKNGLQKFFKIDILAKKHGKYGILETGGTKDGKFDPVKKEWYWRILKSEQSIKADTKFNRTTYPIVFKHANGNDDNGYVLDKNKTKERLSSILLNIDKDYHTNELITVGGIFPKEDIANVTLFLIKNYLEQNLLIKKKNVRTINRMLRKMKQKIHIKYLINTKNRLRRFYERISEEHLSDMKKKIATTTINEIMKVYEDLKNKEMDKIMGIYKMLTLIEEDKTELRKNFDAIDKLQVERERLLVDINQAQLKAMAFKLIALNLYKKMQSEVRSDFSTRTFRDAEANAALLGSKVIRDRLPEKYFDLLSDNFEKIDKKYNSNIQEFVKGKNQFRKLRGELIANALGSKKSYHPEFWNKVFSNKNINDIIEEDNNDEDDDELLINNKRVKNNKNELFSINNGNDDSVNNKKIDKFNDLNEDPSDLSVKNNNVKKNTNRVRLPNRIERKEIDDSHLSDEEKKIVRQQFWLNVRDKLGGRTIFVPFIRTRSFPFSDQYGLFDLLEACIRGGIDKDLLIFEKELTIPVLSQAIRPRGSVIVCGTEDNKDRPTRWRVFLKEELDLFGKMNESDLRIHFYKSLANESVYNKRASLHWYYDNKLFKNVLKYCRMLKSYQDCPLITSREEMSKKLNKVDGIKFGGGKKKK